LTVPHRVHVLYTTSSDAFESGYDSLRRWYPGVDWVDQGTTFRDCLLELVEKSASSGGRFLMPLVDDMLFVRPFTAASLMSELDEDDRLLAVSLRLGENISYCYVRNIATTPPDFKNGYRWAWKQASPGYWDYPMSTDGNIYRTRDMLSYLPKFRFINPNTLEAAMASRPLDRLMMSCEATPCVINLAMNVVQSTYQNRHGDVSADSLNRAFLSGFALDIRPFAGKTFSSCHIEADLNLISDHRIRDAGPVVAAGSDLKGSEPRRIDLREIPCFVINLKEDVEKRERVSRQLKKFGIAHEFILGLRADPKWVGIALSHLKVLRLSRADAPFLVLEDDTEFDEHFSPIVEVPYAADALSLGVSAHGLEEPGQRSWGVGGGVKWEAYDDHYLRVYNMLARHAYLYLSSDFQQKVIDSQIEALTNRSFPHPGDIGLAIEQSSSLVLAPVQPLCRQRGLVGTDRPLQEMTSTGHSNTRKTGGGKKESQSTDLDVVARQEASLEVSVLLRGGVSHIISVERNSHSHRELWDLAHGEFEEAGKARIVQLPLDDGRPALSFSTRDFISVKGLDSFGNPQTSQLDRNGGERGERIDEIADLLNMRTALDLRDNQHDYGTRPFIPRCVFDLIYCEAPDKRVDETNYHHLLATLASARMMIVLELHSPELRDWQDRLSRLGFDYSPARSHKVQEASTRDAAPRKSHVFIRREDVARPENQATTPAGGVQIQSEVHHRGALPIHNMLIAKEGEDDFFLFLDIFVGPDRTKITAVAPFYGPDWSPRGYGVDFEEIDMVVNGRRIRARALSHRLDSYEPCVLFDFEDDFLPSILQERPEISFEIAVGQHKKEFTLSTLPEPSFNVAMSLVVRDENRWIDTFLTYYLRCLKVDHIFVYDNGTADRERLNLILGPYLESGEVTYIPWAYRWRNRKGPRRAMIGQPPQEAHSLNRFANCRWIGFFDTDELLRIPGQSLPEFLGQYDSAQIDGLSFGLRWFRYIGPRSLEQIDDPPLRFRHSYRDEYGRKKQKLFVSPRDVRFLRLHWLEEGKRELAISDSDIFFHHYVVRPDRFLKEGPRITVYDDHMLNFADDLRGKSPASKSPSGGPVQIVQIPNPPHPDNVDTWITHIHASIDAAEAGQSRLVSEVLSVEGPCGNNNRHFLNRICGFQGCRYLEIGSFRGSSTCSALYQNDVQAVCIDNWSRVGGSREVFDRNLEKFAGTSRVELIEGDAF
ncbi:MAG: glycosyltransferase family 92 protein, partial [bacterium]|nr:glycosyltransferase family 92 protein [bacterium]